MPYRAVINEFGGVGEDPYGPPSPQTDTWFDSPVEEPEPMDLAGLYGNQVMPDYREEDQPGNQPMRAMPDYRWQPEVPQWQYEDGSVAEPPYLWHPEVPEVPRTPLDERVYETQGLAVQYGIDPRITYLADVNELGRGEASFAHYRDKWNPLVGDFGDPTNLTQTGGVYTRPMMGGMGDPLMHEYIHALEARMTPAERQELYRLLQAYNPPPGPAQRHHPVVSPEQGGIATGLTAYWDYISGDESDANRAGVSYVKEIPPPLLAFINRVIERLQPQQQTLTQNIDYSWPNAVINPQPRRTATPQLTRYEDNAWGPQ